MSFEAFAAWRSLFCRHCMAAGPSPGCVRCLLRWVYVLALPGEGPLFFGVLASHTQHISLLVLPPLTFLAACPYLLLLVIPTASRTC